MKSLDFLFFYAGYPSLFSGCSGVREKLKRAVGTHHQPSRLPFLVIALVLFLFSIALYFYWKTQERERAINILLSVPVVGCLSLSLCCINNLLWHDRWTINSLSMWKSDFSSSSHFPLLVYLSYNYHHHHYRAILLSFFQELSVILTVPFIEQMNVY
jgi:phosphoglycerol transferase MdoB-like AlkP superfamily enzyme